MIYRTQCKITKENKENIGEWYTDENIVKELAIRIIYDLPIDALLRLFKLEKLDPKSAESEFKLHSSKTKYFERDKIIHNLNQDTIEYELSIDIYDEPDSI